MPGLVSTLLNHAYSMPSRLVQTFLQVTEQVWHPMHLSRFSTIAICARIFMGVPLDSVECTSLLGAAALPGGGRSRSSRRDDRRRIAHDHRAQWAARHWQVDTCR